VAVSAIAINTAGTIRLAGEVNSAGTVVVGTTYYIGATPGAIVSSAPAFSRQVGVGLTSSSLLLAATTAVASLLPNPIAQDLLFVDNTYDIGKSGASRPRDLFASRNAAVGGTLGVSGISTFTADLVATGASMSFQDNEGVALGTGSDATIQYNGTDLVVAPAAVGSGDIVVTAASIEFADDEGVTLGTGKDATLQYNGTDLVIAPAAVGAGDVHVSGGSVEVDDSESFTLGTGKDATIIYDGTDLTISPAAVGSGDLVIAGASAEFADDEGVTLGTGKDATLQYDGTNVSLDTQAVGSGLLIVTGSAAISGVEIDNTATDGDPTLAFTLSGTSLFTMGVDDGDSDKFKIGTTAIGTSTALTIDGSQNVGLSTAAPVSLLDVRGPTGTGAASAGLMTLATNELTIVDNDQLGRIEFRSPIATAGTDAIVSAASIWAEANATFSASVNAADIVFATATSGAATEKMRILSSGRVGIGSAAPDYLFEVGGAGNTRIQSLEAATTGTGYLYAAVVNTGGQFYYGVDSNVGGTVFSGALAYSSFLGSNNATALHLGTSGATRMTVAAGGAVGIGTTAPGSLFHVSGAEDNGWIAQINNTGTGGNANGVLVNAGVDTSDYILRLKGQSGTDYFTVKYGGNTAVTGALSKGSGSFKIDHPLPELADTHNLVHSFVEGPRADLIYRGTVDLVDGAATVDLDVAAGMTAGTWVLLCRDEQVFTSNETSYNHIRGSVSGSTLTIECEDNTCTDTVSWMVVAERQDQHMLDTDWTDENGRPIIEPLKPVDPEPDPEEDDDDEDPGE
jgi:hypothetical protein